MSNIRYTSEHEYVRVEDDVAYVGISEYAQKELGDIVFVELPEIGKTVEKGDEAAVVESVKAASEIYAPVSGEVVEVNETLNDNPALINEDAENDAWIAKLKLSDAEELDSLMDGAAYAKYVEGLA